MDHLGNARSFSSAWSYFSGIVKKHRYDAKTGDLETEVQISRFPLDRCDREWSSAQPPGGEVGSCIKPEQAPLSHRFLVLK